MTVSAAASPCNRHSNADASSTKDSLTLSLGATLGTQVICEMSIIGHEPTHNVLSPAHCRSERADMQAVLVQFDDNGIADVDAKLAPKLRRYDQLTTINDLHRLRCHPAHPIHQAHPPGTIIEIWYKRQCGAVVPI